MQNIFKKLLGKLSSEKTVIAAGGFEILKRITGGEWSGERSLEQYRKSLYVYACISKIAEKVASIDLEMYKVINSKGETQQILANPGLDLLYKCNPFQTRAEFWETMMINLKTTGDAYWLKIRNKSGQVVELWNMRPDFVQIEPDAENFIKSYKFNRPDGNTVVLEPRDVIHFKYSDSLSQYTGLSPLTPGKVRVQTEEYATQYQRDFFLNSARPDAIIKNPNVSLTTGQKKEIREGWEKKFKGVGNSSKVAILEGGLDFQVISLSQKDMDYIEGIRLTRDDILALFKVPKPIVAIVDDVNRANSETAMAIFLGETIKPEMVRIVEKINEELIGPDFGMEYYIDFVDPTPSNREEELSEYDNGIRNNWMLVNEVRAKEGMAPIKGGWTIYRPFGDSPVGGLDQASQPKGIMVGGDTEKDAYEVMPTKKTRIFNFAGHSKLHTKLVIREQIEAKILKTLMPSEKKTTCDCCDKKKDAAPEAATGTRSFVIGDEMRKNYYTLINKRIDLRAETLKNAVGAFFQEQHDRVITALHAETKGVTVKVEQIFDAKHEASLSVEFITPHLQKLLMEAGNEALDMVAPQEDFTDSKTIRAAIKKRAAAFGKEVTRTTLEGLSDTLAEGISAGESIHDLAARIDEVYADFPAYRSERIARTEATIANNQGMLEAYEQSGVANAKEWINSNDDHVRDEHQDVPVGVGTEIVGLRENFSNGISFPQEPNCRCVIGPAFIEE